jgi:hypothetical protein
MSALIAAGLQSVGTLLAAAPAQAAPPVSPHADLPAVAARLPTVAVGVPGPDGGQGQAGVGGAVQPADSGPGSAAPAAGSSPWPHTTDTFAEGHNLTLQPSYRAGYPDYLRTAGLGEIAAVAVPGFTGILILTAIGGLLGYRQARAGQRVRSAGTVRFLG